MRRRLSLIPLLATACASADVAPQPAVQKTECEPQQAQPQQAEPQPAPMQPAEPPAATDPVDLAVAADNERAWRKVRGSLDPNEEVVFYWTGFIYEKAPADPARFRAPGPPAFERPLFRFEGFNVARFADDGQGGYVMLSREAAFYQDPTTGEIVTCWTNPNGERVRVMQVFNDPVNFGVGPVSAVAHTDRVIFHSDVLISYRSPLAGDAAMSRYSAGDVYQSSELFQFYADRADIEDPSQNTVPVDIAWTRVGQYLPWMQMGDAPGGLVYSARGWKVAGGYDALPQRIRDYITSVGKDNYRHAPERYSRPNATSWRVFAAAVASGEYEPSCR